MKVFIGILLVMRLVNLPAIHDYWNKMDTDEGTVFIVYIESVGIFHNQFIAERMARTRFEEIFGALHPDITSLMQTFRDNSQAYWTPHKEMSINETLFLFKGRCSFRQRMPLKPQSTGLKYFLMANRTGYVYDAFLYRGRGTVEVNIKGKGEAKTDREESQTKIIVEYFLKQLPGSKHIIYMDKYYGGTGVMDCVSEYGHGGVMACQGCRPTNLFTGYLGRGKFI
jgi:hypothetical protein